MFIVFFFEFSNTNHSRLTQHSLELTRTHLQALTHMHLQVLTVTLTLTLSLSPSLNLSLSLTPSLLEVVYRRICKY